MGHNLGPTGVNGYMNIAHIPGFVPLIHFVREFLHDPVQCTRGVARFIGLKMTGRSAILMGQCLRCGACCRTMLLIHGNRPVTSQRRYKEILRDYPEYGRLRCTGVTSSGELRFACTWLCENNTCRDYDNRLPICKTYPSTDLYFSIVELPLDCGFKLVAAKPFGEVLKKKMNVTVRP